MESRRLKRSEVISRSDALPAFPAIVVRILATIDDEEANMALLVEHIRHDPVTAARILSTANAAALGSQRQGTVRDLFTAASLIGTARVRELALLGSVGNFFRRSSSGMPSTFWRHSIAVGMCAQELALLSGSRPGFGAVLIAGLLHDVGQLWLQCFRADAFDAAVAGAREHCIPICEAERECFGVDHAVIGGWLAEHWALPENICRAIRFHHLPEEALGDALVPVVHVAEVLANALDLSQGSDNHVCSFSVPACDVLGLKWSADVQPLFGRMEARSRHASKAFPRIGPR
jgi:HD-like signal output (HDOD) protein